MSRRKLFVGLKGARLMHKCDVPRPGQEELVTRPERGIVANDSEVVWLHPSGKLCRVTVAK